MTPKRAASHRRAVALAIAIAGQSVLAHAQTPGALVLLREPRAHDAERWLSDPRARRDPEAFVLERSHGGVAAPRLTSLKAVESLLVRAREETAALDEAAALATLASAAAAAEGLGDVPGGAAWNAEVQLQLAVTAAQAGLEPLAAQAYARAAVLDPSRRLLAAEAPPAQVERFARALEAVAAGPVGELEVGVLPRGASVYLDDRLLGRAPVRVRAAVGRHVLRVEAAGHVPYGTLLDLLEGRRPPVSVTLAPAPELLAARELQASASAGGYPGVVAALRELASHAVFAGQVDVLETMPGSTRALLVRCRAEGCAAPVRLSTPVGRPPPARGRLAAQRLASDRLWLAQGSARRAGDTGPLWRRWYVWGGAAAAVLATAVVAVAATGPEPASRLRVVVEPGDVGE